MKPKYFILIVTILSLVYFALGLYMATRTPTNQPTKQRETTKESIEPYDMTIEAWIERNK